MGRRPRIELRHIRYVIAAAERGSFRRAAEALGVEQSAVSRRIRDIEEEIGGLLFRRHHGGVELTEVGRQFLDRAHAGMSEIGSALDAASLAARESSVLRVGFFDPLATGFQSQLFKSFRLDRPKVRLEFIEAGSAEQIAAVRRGQMDVGFVTEIPPGAGYELMHLWNEPIYVAMSVEDALAGRETVTWNDVANRHFIVTDMAPGPDAANYIRRHIEARGHPPRIERQAVTRESLLHIVSNGSGVTIVGSTVTGLGFPDVVFRPIEGAVLEFSAAHSSASTNPVVRHLLHLARGLSERDESWFAGHRLIRPSAQRRGRAAAPSQSPDPSK